MLMSSWCALTSRWMSCWFQCALNTCVGWARGAGAALLMLSMVCVDVVGGCCVDVPCVLMRCWLSARCRGASSMIPLWRRAAWRSRLLTRPGGPARPPPATPSNRSAGPPLLTRPGGPARPPPTTPGNRPAGPGHRRAALRREANNASARAARSSTTQPPDAARSANQTSQRLPMGE